MDSGLWHAYPHVFLQRAAEVVVSAEELEVSAFDVKQSHDIFKGKLLKADIAGV